MALVNCKECGKQVSTEAVACPSCGAKTPKKTGILGWFALAFFTILVAQCSLSSNNTQSIAQSPEQIKYQAKQKLLSDAKFACRGFVEKSLKSPATAEFQNYNKFAANQDSGSNNYWVSGYVDSQNSFGAMIRTNFACELKRSDSGQWLLVSLK